MCIRIELFLLFKSHQIQYFLLFTLHRYTETRTTAACRCPRFCRQKNNTSDSQKKSTGAT